MTTDNKILFNDDVLSKVDNALYQRFSNYSRVEELSNKIIELKDSLDDKDGITKYLGIMPLVPLTIKIITLYDIVLLIQISSYYAHKKCDKSKYKTDEIEKCDEEIQEIIDNTSDLLFSLISDINTLQLFITGEAETIPDISDTLEKYDSAKRTLEALSSGNTDEKFRVIANFSQVIYDLNIEKLNNLIHAANSFILSLHPKK